MPIGKAHNLALEVGAEQVLRHHDVFRHVAAHHEDVGVRPHHLVDLGAERVLLVVDDGAGDLDALRLDLLADRLEHRLGERRLRHDQVSALGILRENEFGELLALQNRVRLRAHEIALVRQLGDRVGGRDGQHHHLVFPAERQHRAADRGRPHAHDRLHLVDVDQLARAAHAGFGVGLVVLGEIFELAAEQAARGVHLIDHSLMRDAVVRSERRARAGQGNKTCEPDRAGLAEARRGDDERCSDRAGAGEQRVAACNQA